MASPDHDLDALATWLAPLIERLEPRARSALAQRLAQAMREHQQRTMRAQQAPDGSAWAPRLPRPGNLRARRGPMFGKLGAARYLKPSANANEAAVGFLARVQRIAQIHQYGLADRVAKGGPMHTYAARPLIGLPDDLVGDLKDLVLDHLKKA